MDPAEEHHLWTTQTLGYMDPAEEEHHLGTSHQPNTYLLSKQQLLSNF